LGVTEGVDPERAKAAFRPWKHHRTEVQYPDGIAGPRDPASTLPLLPDPYTREEVLAHGDPCEQIVDDVVDALDFLSPDNGFSWYKAPRLEHRIIEIRHIQHGAAQPANRLRLMMDVAIDWVDARREE
jgi:hypothetical protein